MQNGDEALSSIIFTGQDLLVKIPITLESYDIFGLIKFCILIYFNIVQPLVCKMETRLCRALYLPVEVYPSTFPAGVLSFTLSMEDFCTNYLDHLRAINHNRDQVTPVFKKGEMSVFHCHLQACILCRPSNT